MIRQTYKLKSNFCHFVTQLRQRGLVYQTSSDTLPIGQNLLNKSMIHEVQGQIDYSNFNLSVYCGFDPTSSSLHLGNLMSVLMLIRFISFGYKPIALVGGATGLIGDPSGKIQEREQSDTKTIQANSVKISQELELIFENVKRKLKLNEDSRISVINNLDFYSNMNALEFLRDIGKQFRMGPLLAKEHVSSRLKNDGLSFTEFSYTLLQAYDYSRLFYNHNCVIQVGGSDQWGNITNGCDYIRRKYNKTVFGMTTPLLVDKNGQKFGKSEGNAYYLNESLTSREDMNQYLLNQPDDYAIELIRKLTFMSIEEIDMVQKDHLANPSKRIAQTRLSLEIQEILYGKHQKSAMEQVFYLSNEELRTKSIDEIESLLKTIKKVRIEKSRKGNLIDFIVFSGLKGSKSEVKRIMENGGLYINNVRVIEVNDMQSILEKQLLINKYLIIRLGKKDVTILEFEQRGI